MPSPSGNLQPPARGAQRAARGVVSFVFRLLLCAIPIAATVAAGRRVAAFIMRSADDGGRLAGVRAAAPATPPRDEAPAVMPFPSFPAVDRARGRTARINSVELTSYNMRVRAAPAAVIDYYIEQMGARGWTDVTEEFYRISPFANDMQRAAFPSTREAVERYERIRGREAVFRRGERSLYLHTEMGRDGLCDVHLLDAGCADLRALWTRMLRNRDASLRDRDRAPWLELEDVCPGCDTDSAIRFVSMDTTPADLVAGIRRDMLRDGWQDGPSSRSMEGHAAEQFLVRGSDVAVITASPNVDAGGSDALVTVMTVRQP